MRKWFFGLVTLAALTLAGNGWGRTGEGVVTNSIRGTNEVQPEPYTRVANPDTNTVALQIAFRKFVPVGKAGPVIWLAGVSHIGDKAYYEALQKHLDAQTIVLFEGVNAEAHPRRIGERGPRPVKKKTEEASGEQGTNAGFSMQSELAKSLGLVFQLEAIDYDRTNFYNSDLSVLDIDRLMTGDTNAELAQPGEQGTPVGGSFGALLQVMDGSSFLGSIVKMGIALVGSSPQMQATTRLMFVEMLGGLKGDLAEVHGLPEDMQHLLKVLIATRNAHVIEDIRTELAVVPPTGSIAVFYGTGHMDDMEKRVVNDLKYRADGDVWFTAFSADLQKTGLTPGQLKMVRNMMKWQLDQMQR